MVKVAGGFVAGVLLAVSADVSAQRSFGFMSAGEFVSIATTPADASFVRKGIDQGRLLGYVTGVADGFEAAIMLLAQDGKGDGLKRLAATAQCLHLRGQNAGALLENAKALVRSHSNGSDSAAMVILERACVP